MRVKVKLVVFEHPDPTRWSRYCSWCSETHDDCSRGNSVQEVIQQGEDNLIRHLQNRCHFSNLTKMGWKVSENSAIPPIFTDEEAVAQTEYIYQVKINNPTIIELDVELPESKRTIGI